MLSKWPWISRCGDYWQQAELRTDGACRIMMMMMIWTIALWIKHIWFDLNIRSDECVDSRNTNSESFAIVPHCQMNAVWFTLQSWSCCSRLKWVQQVEIPKDFDSDGPHIFLVCWCFFSVETSATCSLFISTRRLIQRRRNRFLYVIRF